MHDCVHVLDKVLALCVDGSTIFFEAYHDVFIELILVEYFATGHRREAIRPRQHVWTSGCFKNGNKIEIGS